MINFDITYWIGYILIPKNIIGIILAIGSLTGGFFIAFNTRLLRLWGFILWLFIDSTWVIYHFYFNNRDLGSIILFGVYVITCIIGIKNNIKKDKIDV